LYFTIPLLMLLLAVGGAYVLGLHAIHTSDHRWCTTLSLLTQQPIPRPANASKNPSRENAYLFYTHLKTLEGQFGCLSALVVAGVVLLLGRRGPPDVTRLIVAVIVDPVE
jgi:hypothetical protein